MTSVANPIVISWTVNALMVDCFEDFWSQVHDDEIQFELGRDIFRPVT